MVAVLTIELCCAVAADGPLQCHVGVCALLQQLAVLVRLQLASANGNKRADVLAKCSANAVNALAVEGLTVVLCCAFALFASVGIKQTTSLWIAFTCTSQPPLCISKPQQCGVGSLKQSIGIFWEKYSPLRQGLLLQLSRDTHLASCTSQSVRQVILLVRCAGRSFRCCLSVNVQNATRLEPRQCSLKRHQGGALCRRPHC